MHNFPEIIIYLTMLNTLFYHISFGLMDKFPCGFSLVRYVILANYVAKIDFIVFLASLGVN